MITLTVYETAEGKCPFNDWFDEVKNVNATTRSSLGDLMAKTSKLTTDVEGSEPSGRADD